MEGLKIPDKFKNNLQSFIQDLKDIYKDELISLILYGSAASGEFIDKHSNLNVLVVLKNTDLDNLKKASGVINKFKMINPLFLTKEHITSSTDIFPIEFIDMQENYVLLYGKDILKEINIDIKNLKFQCEQELKAKLINLRQAYLKINNDKVALRGLLFRSFTSISHILRNVLRLKNKKPPYLKQDILKELALEFPIDIIIWEKILAAKNKKIKLSNRDSEELFVNFVRALEKIVEIVDKS
jgi:predicted nucleotidyltransferase